MADLPLRPGEMVLTRVEGRWYAVGLIAAAKHGPGGSHSDITDRCCEEGHEFLLSLVPEDAPGRSTIPHECWAARLDRTGR